MTRSNILEIDVTTSPPTTSTFGAATEIPFARPSYWPPEFSYSGGALAPNGKIYCAPAESRTMLVIDPIAKTTSTFSLPFPPEDDASSKYTGAVLAPNGRIYFIPLFASYVAEINPSNNSIITFYTGGTSVNSDIQYIYQGGVLAPNGKIYGIPYDSSPVLEISTGSIYEPADWTLGAYHNKF
jgi:hypothetical protein